MSGAKDDEADFRDALPRLMEELLVLLQRCNTYYSSFGGSSCDYEQRGLALEPETGSTWREAIRVEESTEDGLAVTASGSWKESASGYVDDDGYRDNKARPFRARLILRERQGAEGQEAPEQGWKRTLLEGERDRGVSRIAWKRVQGDADDLFSRDAGDHDLSWGFALRDFPRVLLQIDLGPACQRPLK